MARMRLNKSSWPSLLVRWGAKFIELVDALKHFSAGLPSDQVFFWIDIFAINYHPSSQAPLLSPKETDEVVTAATSGTLVVIDEKAGPS